jgi:hypothetical protein
MTDWLTVWPTVSFNVTWGKWQSCSSHQEQLIRHWDVSTITTHLHSKHPVEERVVTPNANEIAPYHPICNPLIAFYTPPLPNLHSVNGCRLMVFHPQHIEDLMLSFIKKRGWVEQNWGGKNINSEVRMTDFIIWELQVWEEETHNRDGVAL